MTEILNNNKIVSLKYLKVPNNRVKNLINF